MPTLFPSFAIVLPFLTMAIVYFILKAKNQLKPQHTQAIFPILFLLAGSIAMSCWVYASSERTKNYSFNGVIQKAVYEKPKQIPTITINGIEYNLFYLNYPDYDTIVAGDIAIKERGTWKFQLIKKNKK